MLNTPSTDFFKTKIHSEVIFTRIDILIIQSRNMYLMFFDIMAKILGEIFRKGNISLTRREVDFKVSFQVERDI